jgi:glycosyltransferase involved in cell wall biosynthesis
MTVSVIIPTYHRPKLLKETIESVWAQTVRPDEIIIGDDSKNDETEQMVLNELIPISPIPIRYFHHRPSLKEVRNVDFQYNQAKGDLILHLHDDDPIYPRCIELLKPPFEKHPEIVASFGLQRIIDENGKVVEGSEDVNRAYFRTPEREGVVDGFNAGAVSMFPNNGFMVRREAACAVGYSDEGRAGLATDFYFGFRLGKLEKPFYFVNEYTALCRLTTNSQSRTADTDNAYRAVKILLEDCKPGRITPEIKRSLSDRIPLAITIAVRKKDHLNAFRWLFSDYYRKQMFSPRWTKRLGLALYSSMAMAAAVGVEMAKNISLVEKWRMFQRVKLTTQTS